MIGAGTARGFFMRVMFFVSSYDGCEGEGKEAGEEESEDVHCRRERDAWKVEADVYKNGLEFKINV